MAAVISVQPGHLGLAFAGKTLHQAVADQTQGLFGVEFSGKLARFL